MHWLAGMKGMALLVILGAGAGVPAMEFVSRSGSRYDEHSLRLDVIYGLQDLDFDLGLEFDSAIGAEFAYRYEGLADAYSSVGVMIGVGIAGINESIDEDPWQVDWLTVSVRPRLGALYQLNESIRFEASVVAGVGYGRLEVQREALSAIVALDESSSDFVVEVGTRLAATAKMGQIQLSAGAELLYRGGDYYFPETDPPSESKIDQTGVFGFLGVGYTF